VNTSNYQIEQHIGNVIRNVLWLIACQWSTSVTMLHT